MSTGRNRPLVAIYSNSDWNVVNYRFGLINALLANGYEVLVLAPKGRHFETLKAAGVAVEHIEMSRRGTSPLAELALLWRSTKALRKARPEALLTFTVKPNIHGSLAARITGTKVINNVSGLGSAFFRNALFTAFISRLYKTALRKSGTVFFQNIDDQNRFISAGIVQRSVAKLLPGSGVDLRRFRPRTPKDRRQFTFLLVARLLWDKGVAEFAEAARALRGDNVRFQILGIVEEESPAAVSIEALRNWESEGILKYLGEAEDVRPHLADTDCVVLPSYYPEGVPRALLEAAAMGIPVITTDTPGCRDAVSHARTGFLCQPRSVASLVAAMKQMLALSPTKRSEMGALGRQRMHDQFDERLVHDAYIEALREAGVE